MSEALWSVPLLLLLQARALCSLLGFLRWGTVKCKVTWTVYSPMAPMLLSATENKPGHTPIRHGILVTTLADPSLSLLHATNCLLMWCLHSQCVASLYFLHPRPWGPRGLDVWLWPAPGRCLSELKESPVTWLFRWGIRGPGRSNILSRIVQPDTAKPSACSLPLSTVGTFFFFLLLICGQEKYERNVWMNF